MEQALEKITLITNIGAFALVVALYFLYRAMANIEKLQQRVVELEIVVKELKEYVSEDED